ncbi:MAG: hypothetical protein EHM42_02850, partial [Planctomycetaceae bacterium]
MTRHRGSLGLALALVTCCCLPVRSAEPDGRAPRLRKIHVPADTPAEWPAGEWEPWNSSRLDAVLREIHDAQERDRSPPLVRAEYT